MAEKETLYRVQFINNGERYELYVREITQGQLWGFIEIADFVWTRQGQLVIDTSEEQLKTEFEGVTRTYIPMHNVLRIDAVEKQGPAKISEISGKIATFPGPIYTKS